MDEKCPLDPECKLFDQEVDILEQIYSHEFAANAIATQCPRLHKEDKLSKEQCPYEVVIPETSNA